MQPDWKRLGSEVVASLSEEEKEESVAYVEQRVVPAGEPLSLAGQARSFDEPVVVAFVDLEPGVNWTHRARYLVLGVRGGVRASIDADRPPFLKGASPQLRAVHRGARAPEWAVVTGRPA